MSLCELVVGGKEGLQPIEKTVIDRCVRLVYREQALGLETAKTPLLQDLYEELLRQPEPEARRVATALELYCTGSFNLFNHPTNVKTDSRVVCIVLKNMGENLRKIAMHITNEFVSQAVDQNFHEGAATWCYFDEFHILLRDPLTASYFVAVWKMLRKKGCVQDYQRIYNVGIRQTEAPGLYKYYSTQRPVDIGTFPKPPYNKPDEIFNYDQRIPVENGSFLAWGYLTYTRPLTEKQASDYELRPAPDNPDRPRPIAEQMKNAAKLAEADRGSEAPAPQRRQPDRGDR